jgi:formimidoylglutamate deiminase
VKWTFKAALLPGGFAEQVSITVKDGRIAAITRNDTAKGSASATHGVALPGMVNLHSHAFQRAMAGWAEVHSANDTFWGWRERMYGLAEGLSLEEVKHITRYVYAEMLQAGYTSVAEFHYLHKPNHSASPLETAHAMRVAAQDVGMRQTLLPVAYQRGGFDGRALNPTQQRFALTTPEIISLWDALSRSETPTLSTGLALHSLRAVDLACVRELVQHCGTKPIHIHIAEQRQEVSDCVSVHGLTPIELLLAEQLISPRWCLVHATHASAAELTALAQHQAVIGYCASTEANLGDGVFDFNTWHALGGAIGIGSDSQVCINPAEELRLIEYQQRLLRERRPGTALQAGEHIGAHLWQAACAGGSQVTGTSSAHPPGAYGLTVGAPFDVVELADDHPAFIGQDASGVLDTFVMAERAGMVQRVWVAGEMVVENGRHRAAAQLAAAYRQTLLSSTARAR